MAVTDDRGFLVTDEWGFFPNETKGFTVYFNDDGTFVVQLTYHSWRGARVLEGERRDKWLADMEQRIAQARSHT